MKQLIIIAFYFDISQMSRSGADAYLQEYIKIINETFNDEEIKEQYIIKELIIPTDYTKVECIYPVGINSNNNLDINIEHQIKKVETEILKHKDPKLWDEWNILMRWAKLKELHDEEHK